MTENLGRKATLIVALIAISLAFILIPDRPFRLGLDLQGGTRMVYRFDFEEAIRQGHISAEESGDRTTLLTSFCDIIRDRVDPSGVKEISIRPEGSDRVVIEVPGAALQSETDVGGTLLNELPAGGTEILLDPSDPEEIKAFPLGGGIVEIGSEQIEYARRDENRLEGLKRGYSRTDVAGHAVGSRVELLTTDRLQILIENIGDLQVFIAAEPFDPELQRVGTDLQKEKAKVDAWLENHPGEKIDAFNRLPPTEGGPVANLRWYPRRIEQGEPETPIGTRIVGLLVPSREEWIFSGDDIERVGPDQDNYGLPAVRVEMSTATTEPFADFSGAHVNRGMAIVINGEIATLATINDKLTGSFIITGGTSGFTQSYVTDLVSILKSGSLRIPPELLSKNRVGASLGNDHIETGVRSALVALVLIVVFMLGFYRRLGVFSVIGLILNLLFMMGAMAFIGATLTLPGVAGVVLTLGMAVDGNILILERLREELGRGLKPLQAAKAAFERAAVTIIDSNLTTLIAGLILQNLGSGPIRGFAVMLNIGILTTLFTVIVVSEVLIFWDIKRGTANFSMGRMFETPKIPFMRVSKYCIGVSLVVIAAGLALFVQQEPSKKFGTDFLGGFTMVVRTEEPTTVAQIRERVATIPGEIGTSNEIKELSDSAVGDRGFTKFKITYKLGEAVVSTQEEDRTAETGEQSVRSALSDLLARDPLRIALTPGAGEEGRAALSGQIDFDLSHPAEDVTARLTGLGIASASATALDEAGSSFSIAGAAAPEHSVESLTRALRETFEATQDSNGRVFSLAQPVPESSLVGPQVGSELRDRAILAVLLSLLGTLIYLRVRFAEYGFGLGVIVALAHDVLITVGALAVVNELGLVQSEIDLAMIAAFLTIIGFSQNDTIVIFDRVRENRPKSDKPWAEVLNDSINQTLSRTLLTSVTVLMAMLVLFGFNYGTRNVLEAFSFAMIVGVISGAYSTIYIASPVLLWWESLTRRRAEKAAEALRAQQTGSAG